MDEEDPKPVRVQQEDAHELRCLREELDGRASGCQVHHPIWGGAPTRESFSTVELIAAARTSKDCGAGEPVGDGGRSRARAVRAWKAYLEGKRLERKEYWKLDDRQTSLFNDYINGTLAREVDKASTRHGHRSARTNDYGFAPGQNMCTQKPKGDAIALAVLGPQPQAGAVDSGRSHRSRPRNSHWSRCVLAKAGAVEPGYP